MLVRNVNTCRNSATSHFLSTSFAQLQLPWLAPAQLRWTATHASRPPHATTQRRRRSPSRSSQPPEQIRHLATAAGTEGISHHAGSSQGIPWYPSEAQKSDLLRVHPFLDGDIPITIDRSTEGPPPLFKATRGVTGSVSDLLQHLHISLRVGRRARAETILQRLAEVCQPGSAEMRVAQQAYLGDSLRTLTAHGRGSEKADAMMKEMQIYFEKEMRKNSTVPDAVAIVTMVRAGIRALEGSQRQRTVHRYLDLSQELGDEAFGDVLYSEEYTDDEFAVLNQVASSYYPDTSTADFIEPSVDDTLPRSDESSLDTLSVTDSTTKFHEDFPEVRQTPQKGQGLVSVRTALDHYFKASRPAPDQSEEERYARQHERQVLMEETSLAVAIDRWRKENEDMKKLGIDSNLRSKPMGVVMWEWYKALVTALEAEMKLTKEVLAGGKDAKLAATLRGDDPRATYGPYLELLSIDKLAASTILFMMGRISHFRSGAQGKVETPMVTSADSYEREVKIGNLCVGLGKEIEEECSMEASRTRMRTDRRYRREGEKLGVERLRKLALRSFRDKKMMREVLEEKVTAGKQKNHDVLASLAWPLDVKAKLGAMLVDKLLKSAKIMVTRPHPRTKEMVSQMQPAFLQSIKWNLGKKVGVITPHPDLIYKLRSEPPPALLAKRMPMIVEPRPWTSWNDGGYLHYTVPVIRLPKGNSMGKDFFQAAHIKGDTEQLLAGLNVLSRTPWRVQPDVFRVQLEAWNTGESIANFAPLSPWLPALPETKGVGADGTDLQADKMSMDEWKQAVHKLTGLHSKRSFQNFQMEVARALLGETLYLPHNVDFRGRAYPIPPYLNHMGADNVRGLLVFDKGKPLGMEGLRWLKIHLANVYGYDKHSLQEREDFAMEHIDDIRDSVNNPLNGKRWWLGSGDAWQTLSACFELVHALDHPEGPEKFISHLPIQQDGTCNGLQHYAALGGDEAGAAQVNLLPGDKPADVYTGVADAVAAAVARDAAQGDPLAQFLDGRVTRKLVKAPVMTNVYGVTFYGAQLQVRRQLEEMFPDVRLSDNVNYRNLSKYVAEKIFKSLGRMFSGAQAIQEWFGQCADRISTCLTEQQIEALLAETSSDAVVPTPVGGLPAVKSGRINMTRTRAATDKDEPQLNDEQSDTEKRSLIKYSTPIGTNEPLFKSTVVWTTPLRLPVAQPYRKSQSKRVSTNLQLIHLHEPHACDPIHKKKQLQAFPPNFVHSLDASHMLLSAIKCEQDGLSFASVHDSFWTHACDVKQLSENLRDQFIAMHSDDIVGRLKQEFEARYHGCYYLQGINAVSTVGKQIRMWRLNNHKFGKLPPGQGGEAWELRQERNRIRLLSSENAEERAQGQAMVTPGSIVANADNHDSFAPIPDWEGYKLGEMPSETADTNSDAERSEENSTESLTNGVIAEEADQLEAGSKSTNKTSRKGQRETNKLRKVYIWLPLTFPDVPAKGSFDVKRLKESKYFFH